MNDPANFKDHFSGHAEDYARFRPRYPDVLFRTLAEYAPGRSLAWDCGTGTGQAAAGLAQWFDQVIATDASERQIANAVPAARVQYRVAPAEDSGLDDRCADLVTVAQALHWFDRRRFFAEARRVLAPGGLLAFWTYPLLQVSPGVDALIREFHDVTVGPWWPPERQLVDEGYRSIQTPFDEYDPPPIESTAEWSLRELVGYLGTWSAVRRYRADRDKDPVAGLLPGLSDAWGDADRVRSVRWPLSLRLCRMPG